MGKHHWSQQAAGGGVVGALFPLLAGLTSRGVFARSIVSGLALGSFMGYARSVSVQQEYFGHIVRAKAKQDRQQLELANQWADITQDPYYQGLELEEQQLRLQQQRQQLQSSPPESS